MTTIHIGRPGEEPRKYDLSDIMAGAVRESGDFPEFFEKDLPADISAVAVTGVERKLREHRMAAEPFNCPIFMPPSLLPRPVEDSKEEQNTQEDIAIVKLKKGFENPVLGAVEKMGLKTGRAFLRDIAHRAGTNNIEHLITFSDDRAVVSDETFRDVLYGELENHYDPQVREVLNSAHEVPGKRVKETDGARLGIANSVYLWQEAMQELSRNEIPYNPKQRMDTTLYLKPLIPGSLPFPEEGIIVKGFGPERLLQNLSTDHIKKIEKGRILGYDHLECPGIPGVPSWATIHHLKAAIYGDYAPVQESIYGSIDIEKARKYLTYVHSPGAVMTAFLHAIEAPKIDDSTPERRNYFIGKKPPRTVLTTGNMLEGKSGLSGADKKAELEDIFGAVSVGTGRKVSKQISPLTLRSLQGAVHSAQAFIVTNPNRYKLPKGYKNKYGSAENLKLLRQLETQLMAAYFVTMSTMVGASAHIGRPHLIDKDFYKKFMRYHPDLSNLGLTGDVEKEAYYLFKDEEGLREGLERIDETTYNSEVKAPPNEFLTEAQIRDITGLTDLGYVVNVYGSASGFADATYRHPRNLVYQLSRLNNVTTAHGGGTRSGMLGMFDGALEASNDGYHIQQIAIRSERDVSPLEGDIDRWIKERGYTISLSRQNKRHLTFNHGQNHVIKLQNILPRQAALAEIAHACVLADGGKGSILEGLIIALHNARINITGKGFLGHNRIIPLVVMNRDIVQCGIKRGIYDVFLEPLRNNFDLLGIKECKGEDPVPEVLQFLKDHAEGRFVSPGQKEAYSFDLSTQEPNISPKNGEQPVPT